MSVSEPLLITVKAAADKLSITPWSVYRLLDDKAIESVYQGRRRYVLNESLRAYVEGLPVEQSTPESA